MYLNLNRKGTTAEELFEGMAREFHKFDERHKSRFKKLSKPHA